MSTKQPNLMDLLFAPERAEVFREFYWHGTFPDYLKILEENPKVARTAFQRMYDMILSYGARSYTENREEIVHYNFFDDPIGNGRDAVFGLDRPLMELVQFLKAAARGYGAERRVLLLHGPVGSSKSTIVRLLKKGLEGYSRSDEAAMYTFAWVVDGETFACPMHEEPLHLIPPSVRVDYLAKMNQGLEAPIICDGDLCPACRYYYKDLMDRYGGDWAKMLDHVQVRRLLLSEKDRTGIGTFQPKDEKNQDSTELTGDINYRKIAEYGSESDPRAFNFDGEFNVANRGLVEFIEVLKLDVAFLYDLLGASQEHKIKPKKFAQTDIDEVIIGHTNEPEYRKLQSNEYMEALRDRTVKIDVPYVTRLADEICIYEKDYNPARVQGCHIAPHVIEVAAMWAVLTRLEEPKKHNLTLLQKLKLYSGQSVEGFTEDHIKELRAEAKREGLEGISPRYVQDKISNALVNQREGCVNPFMVLNELEDGLTHHSLITSEEQRAAYRSLLGVVKEEYADIVKGEVQRAISADEDAIKSLFSNYVDNVKAYIRRERVKNRYTGQDEPPNEKLMRSIEERIGITESRKEDFRREIMNYIAALAIEGRQFDYRSDARLQKALELKLFEDKKDSIKLTTLITSVVDQETQAKIDAVKTRMIRDYGYCNVCATDTLNYVASIFARGDAR